MLTTINSVSTVEEVKRKAWACYNRLNAGESLDKPGAVKDSLLALKLTVDCNEAQSSLFKEGPAIMQIRKLEERLAHIESGERTQELRKEILTLTLWLEKYGKETTMARSLNSRTRSVRTRINQRSRIDKLLK